MGANQDEKGHIRASVNLRDIHDALKNGRIKVDKERNSLKCSGEFAEVSINSKTGKIIQINRRESHIGTNKRKVRHK